MRGVRLKGSHGARTAGRSFGRSVGAKSFPSSEGRGKSAVKGAESTPPAASSPLLVSPFHGIGAGQILFAVSYWMAVAVKTSGGFCNTQQQWLHSTRELFLYGHSHSNAKECKSKKTKRPASLRVKATNTKVELDFNDPSWKQKFQEDWDDRFNLPRITDIYDLKPRPTTFSLKKKRTLIGDEDSTPMDMWNGYVNNDDRALMKVIKYSSPTSAGAECIDPDCSWVEQWVHRAGPRKDIYYEPNEVKAAIVTCGGLCPGLNDVIRQVVFTLETYGVKNIVGIPFGFRGFFEKGLKEMPLSRNLVENINLAGGSFLGVSRGGAKTSEIVDSIQARRIDMLFVLGGNGTHAGANAIHDECRKRKLKVSVVAVPKTIDNDIPLMDKTFGFDTAVEEAQRAINSAYIEARSAYHGIGLVKLMGRSSGFIAMHASLSSGQVDVCLIPEVPFTLDGEYGVLQHLEQLLKNKGFCVVCVAEAAGQELLQNSGATDASGNAILSDIGVHMQQKIKTHFKGIGVHADIKYIDPTDMVRACRANASDAILCTVLGQNAVHGAFAGFSGITSCICNTHYVYLPITQVITASKRVNHKGRMWYRCLSPQASRTSTDHLSATEFE